MGMIKKIINGKRTWFKVIKRCDRCIDDGVKVVASKSGRDLKAILSAKEMDEEVVKSIFGSCCDKCNITCEDLALEDVKRAKKVFSDIEIA